MTAPPSAARDVINADAIRAAIERRSRQRRDHAEIARWLRTHFFRWTINSFAHVLPVRSVEHWRVCIGAQAPAPWFLRKLAAGDAAMVYIDPEHGQLRERESRMVEFFNARLGSRLDGKFQRIAFAAAEAAWQRDHERMQRRSRRGWWPSQAHALAETATTPNGRFVEIRASGRTLRTELAYESFHMQHCLGQFAERERLQGGYGEHYARACEQGRLRLFSLRDAGNRPHVTVSLAEDLGEWRVDQIKGKQNTVPAAKYLPDVLCLLNALRPRETGNADLQALGIVARNEGEGEGEDAAPAYVAFAELQDRARQHALLGAFPHLLGQHPRPDALAQWIALGAGAAILGEAATPHGPVLAALQAMHGAHAGHDQDAAHRGDDGHDRLAGALAQALPQWPPAQAATLPPAPAPAAGWWRRLLGRGGAPAAAERARVHRAWALAVADPLFFRHGVDGASARARLAAPASAPPRLLAQVEAELGTESDHEAAAAVESFCASFFRLPALVGQHALAWAQDEERTTGARAAEERAADADPSRDLLAWHAMRQAYALRLLAAAGRIDEARGWRLLLLNAQRVQDCFDGWPGFGAAAVRGHAGWLRAHGRDPRHAKSTQVALHDFHEQFGCAWTRLDWAAFDLAEAVAAPTYAAAL